MRKQVIADISRTDNISRFAFLAKVARRLRSQGYEVLGSRSDRATDLLAEKGDKKISIHIVCEEGALGEKAIEALESSGGNLYGFDEVWIVSESSFTEPAKALARQKRIRLIDNTALQNDLNF